MQNQEKIEETTIDLEKVEIGEDVPQVEPAKVVIESYRIDKVAEKFDKLVLVTKHPDVSDRSIEISGIKHEIKGKLKSVGLWIKLDKDRKLGFNSGVSVLLRLCKVTAIYQLKGLELDTTTDEGGYLVVKAY